MRALRLVRRAASLAGMVVAGVLLFDTAAYFAFPDLVRRIEPKYASDVAAEALREARVQPYYRASESRGFDIAPGARSVDWRPPDVEPYPIWGNSVGCFDEEFPFDTPPDIYLAGDSFTWGFSPYEAKFGTILEREAGLLVYACGVWHSGQRHQFDKFLDIADSYPGWPALVIVNVYDNDYINDFAFPHTTVVNGGLVETKYMTEENGKLEVHKTNSIKEAIPSLSMKYYLKTYSATANIVNVFLRDTVNRSALGRRWIAGFPEDDLYPIRSEAAAPNRRVIREWIDHARRNGYELRFALIPDADDIGHDIYREFRAFLAEEGAVAWDFEAYVLANGLRPNDLYWPVDIHFNPEGNRVYAEFLLRMLDAEAAAGTLPARLASGAPMKEARSAAPD